MKFCFRTAALVEVTVRAVGVKCRSRNHLCRLQWSRHSREARRGLKRCAIWCGVDSIKRRHYRKGPAEELPSRRLTTSPMEAVEARRKWPKRVHPLQLSRRSSRAVRLWQLPVRRPHLSRPMSPFTHWGKLQPVDIHRLKRRPVARAAAKPGKIAVSLKFLYSYF